MKQTAVEWLADQIQKQVDIFCPGGVLDNNMIEQAKQMEKEQITNAYSNGRVDEQFKGTNASFYRKTSEQYYNETFKSE